MQNCQQCNTLNLPRARFCRACLAPMGYFVSSISMGAADVGGPSGPTGSSRSSGGRPSRTAMLLTGLVLLPCAFLFSLSWGGPLEPPAIASPQSLPQVSQDEVRRAEIQEASTALRQKLDELEHHLARRSTLSEAERGAWSTRWQDDLQNIKDRYHIWGTVDANHPDARAEDALRNALLYLYSLKHMATRDRSGVGSQDYRKVRDSVISSLSAAAHA